MNTGTAAISLPSPPFQDGMKTTTLIYCGPDGEAGKALAQGIRSPTHRVMLRDAATFNRDVEACEHIVVMSDVSAFHRDRLIAAYGLCKVMADGGYVDQQPLGLVGETASAQYGQNPLIAKHRGRGRYFVMRGDVIVSGPHTKDEAQRLAA